jgi:hypothetical protein
MKHSAASIEKMRQAKLGKKQGPLSAEHKAKISKASTGRRLSTQHIELLRKARVGKTMSAETRSKISEKLKGIKKGPMSAATKHKISLAKKNSKKVL